MQMLFLYFKCNHFNFSPCMIFLSTTEYVFFYFSSLIQPSLEEDVSTEILLANKKLRSNVWKEFELTMLDDGTYKAICKHCKKEFVASNRAGTSHLKLSRKVVQRIFPEWFLLMVILLICLNTTIPEYSSIICNLHSS